MTHQRTEVFREVAGAVDHPDAEAVDRRVRKRIPSISLDTVYRSLWLFSELGLVTTWDSREAVSLRCQRRAAPPLLLPRLRSLRTPRTRGYDALLVPESDETGDREGVCVELKGL